MSSRFDEKANIQTNAVAASEISLARIDSSKKDDAFVEVRSADDARLAELGYKGEFRREFSARTFFDLLNRCTDPLVQLIETVAFAFSIMAVIGGVSSTLSFGLASGTPATCSAS